MGYPQFNLTTLQLVAPTANMTKAEYKAAYGIDLDAVNIKAFKLVLFGGEKYAIDQIKEVEDGIKIYFNGRIMSITDDVEVSEEVYDVANAKPIYCHPISLLGSSNNVRFTCLIFNNSETPFTIDSFVSYIEALYAIVGDTIRIMISGGYVDNGNTIIATYLGLSSSSFVIVGLDTSGIAQTKNYSKEDFIALFDALYDGVNKIN